MKILRIIAISFLIYYLFLSLTINPWCITRSMANFGIKVIIPYDLMKASIVDNRILLLEADTSVRYGRGKNWSHSNSTVKMRCDLNIGFGSRQDITDEVRKHEYRNMPPEIARKRFQSIRETERILYARGVQCGLEKDDTVLVGRKIQLATDDTLNSTDVFQQVFFYTAGSHRNHPMHKYVIMQEGQDTTIIPIAFVYEGYESKLRRETPARMFSFIFYPLAFVADIATFPIQLFSFLGSSYSHCPEWTCGP